MLYLANQPTSNTKPIAFLKNQEIIAGPTRMQDILVRGIPHHEQIAYASYINTLPAFISATAQQTRVLADPQSYFPVPISMQLRELPFGIPPISVAPKEKRLTRDQLQAWSASIPGLVEVPHGKSTVFQIPKPVRSSLRALFEICSPAAQCPEGTMSLASTGSYFTVMKLLLAFLSTHTYPAFQVPAGSNDVQFSYAESVQFVYKPNTGVIHTGRLEKRGLDCLQEAIDTPSNKSRKIAGETHKETAYALFESEAEASRMGFVGEAKDGVAPSYTYENAINIAKPAPLRPEINYGPSRSLPNLSGIACPYFDGMVLQDVMTIPQIIAKYFFRNLGATHQEAVDGMQAIKTGYAVWGKTIQGKELAHVFRCVQIAIEAQARLYVCVDNEVYSGCSIMGEQFSVGFQGKLYEVQPRLEQFAAFIKVNSHESAIADIVSVIEQCTLREGETAVDFDKLEIHNSRQLWSLTSKYVMPKSKPERVGTGEDITMPDVEEDLGREQWKKIQDAFKSLVFNENYIKCNPDNFNQSLFDAKNGIPPALDKAMYLASPEYLFNRNILFVVLSQFGPLAPSVFNRGGSVIEIPYIVDHISKQGDTTTITKAPEKQYPHETILISQKSLEAACEDMAEMFKRRVIMQNPKERARNARNIAYEGATLQLIWDKICSVCKGEAGIKSGPVAKALTADEILAKAARDKKLQEMVTADF